MNSKKGLLLAYSIYLSTLLPGLTNTLIARNYYVDPSSTNTITDGSLLNPWKTIAQVNSGTTSLNPGDTVFFKRNQIYTGRLNITRSGSASSPIVYTNYGNGTLPEFDNAVSDIINLNGRQYVIIDGIKITDNSISSSDHAIQAKISYAINLTNSPNCTIRNCEISLVGIGIAATTGSDNTTITGNYIHNLRMVRNTPTSINANDDYGANPMVIGSSNNIISKNIFEECWAISYDYGYDGGAVEFFGTAMNNNKIVYNTAINCNGFIEIGSSSNGTAQDNIIAYNKIINCGAMGTYQNGSRFTVAIKNIQYYNNTVVETIKQYANPSALFWMSGTGTAGMVVLKNNIFWLSSGVDLASSKFNSGQMIHKNNIYRMDTGLLAITIDSSERLSSTEDHFVSTNEDPSVWDYNLVSTSTALDFGINLGYTTDFAGKSIVGNPDAGILEFDSSKSTPVDKPLSVKISSRPLDCSNETTSATALVSGGKPPYTYSWNTVPEQTTATALSLVSGDYTVVVSDSIGAYTTASVTIKPPEYPGAPKVSVIEPSCVEPTGKITVVSPTGNGVTYSVDGQLYQQNTLFTNLAPASYPVTAKNILGCISGITTATINTPTIECTAGLFSSSTTCLSYQNGGSGPSLGRLCYTTRTNRIASISPSQFIYYTIIQAPSVNFCVDIVQVKTIPGFKFFGIAQRNQVYLWGNTCTRISTGSEPSSGQGRICITNAVPGTRYILSVKYDAKNLSGNSFTGSAPASLYTFESRINGVTISGSNTSIVLTPNCLNTTLFENETSLSSSRILSTESNDPDPFNVSLSSNSMRGTFSLSITGATRDVVTIRIMDIAGRNVQVLENSNFQTIEFGKNLSPGVYTVEVSQGINKKTVKAVKLFH